jgi:hypothetical protein
MPLVTVTAADGTTSEVAGISLGETSPGLEEFLIVDASNRVVAYRQPTKAAADAAAKADAGEETAETTAQAGWKFDPVTGQPVTVTAPTTTATVNPVTGQPVVTPLSTVPPAVNPATGQPF